MKDVACTACVALWPSHCPSTPTPYPGSESQPCSQSVYGLLVPSRVPLLPIQAISLCSPNGLSPLRQSACAIPFALGKSLEKSLKPHRLLLENLTGILSTLKGYCLLKRSPPLSEALCNNGPSVRSTTSAKRQYSNTSTSLNICSER